MNTSEVSLKEVELLTVRVLDGLHEPKDMDRLSVLLRSCPVARSRYVELVIQDSLLHWETSEVLEFETSEPKTVPFPKMPLVASFAAAILAIFGVSHWKNRTSSSSRGSCFGCSGPYDGGRLYFKFSGHGGTSDTSNSFGRSSDSFIRVSPGGWW